MTLEDRYLSVRMARSDADLRAAERLRYEVFVEELGGDGPLVDHTGRFERDAFDPFYDHLVLVDARKSEADLNHVVGVYRLMTRAQAIESGAFYSEGEYDLSLLKASGRSLLELGRSCVAAEHRGGVALHLLWSGLADYVRAKGIEILFGVASLHGTDVEALALPLSHLHHAFLAPPELRVRALERAYQPMDLIPVEHIDRVAAMRAVPQLIKSYLRLGGFVGDGAFVDHAFNTVDVCLVMDTARLNTVAAARFTSGGMV
ncbi:MAG: GNAT family N-acyltransferase [Pseudomonadota bacterium]